MSKKRFFAFGCSYTDYVWLTWADILCYDLKQQDYAVYNYGSSGTGNYAIFAHMMLADAVHKFSPNDIIMVVWSSWHREDRYCAPICKPDDGWHKLGSVLNSPAYDDDYIRKYWSVEHDIIKNSTSILAARGLYNLAFEGTIEQDFTDEHADNQAKQRFIITPVLNNVFYFNTYRQDHDDLERWGGHPNALRHLNYIKEVIEPATGRTFVNSNTDMWVKDHWEKFQEIYYTYNKKETARESTYTLLTKLAEIDRKSRIDSARRKTREMFNNYTHSIRVSDGDYGSLWTRGNVALLADRIEQSNTVKPRL